MLLKISGLLLIISVIMVFVGIDQIFTVKYGEKWYPCLSASFWKLPDDISSKLILYGIILFLSMVILGAIFKV